MKKIIIYLTFLVLVSCSYNEKSYFKNELLTKEIDTFIDDAQNCGINHESKYILMFWDEFGNDTISISLHMTTPASFKDLYCVINHKEYKVLVYANFDLSKYVYTKNAYKVDTSDLVTDNNLGVNWYSSGFYFDGINIYRPNSVTKEASFPEGNIKFADFFKDEINYPAIAIENKVEGQVVVTFDISKTGKISNQKIYKGIGYGCDEEVLRAIGKIPLLNPKTIFETPVESSSYIRITFVLDSLGIEVESGQFGNN